MVRSRYARGAVEVRSKYTLVVRSRYARGAVEVYARGAVEVHLCTSGTLTDEVPVLSCTLTFYLAVL